MRVIRSGLCSTIQDLGRMESQSYGVAVGGAVDRVSHEMANRLVLNDPNAATLEMTLLGDEIEWDSDVVIAITGADLMPRFIQPVLDGNASDVPQGRPVFVRSGTRMQFRSASSGCRAYLGVAGGFDVPMIMNSRSTQLRAQFGGHFGRKLQTHDMLPIGTPSSTAFLWMEILRKQLSKEAKSFAPKWFVRPFDLVASPIRLRVLRGEHFEWLSPPSKTEFWTREFHVSKDSDRMGCRLEQCPMTMAVREELVSDGLVAGTIQLPPSGDPILILSDGAPTGGYPKIAHVSSVDLPKAAQIRPGDSILFEEISLEQAQDLLREQRRMMNDIEDQILQRWKSMTNATEC